MALSFETYKTYKVVGGRRKHWAIRLHTRSKMKQETEWLIEWMLKYLFLNQGFVKYQRLSTQEGLTLMSLIFFLLSFRHSFILSFRFKTGCFSKRGKKTDPSDQCNLRNYPKYFYSYIDVTMPIVAFYLSGTALKTKCLFNHQQSAWTIPCWIHPISSDLGS